MPTVTCAAETGPDTVKTRPVLETAEVSALRGGGCRSPYIREGSKTDVPRAG